MATSAILYALGYHSLWPLAEREFDGRCAEMRFRIERVDFKDELRDVARAEERQPR